MKNPIKHYRSYTPRVSAARALRELKRYARDNNKTATDIAEESGLSSKTIWAWLNGKRRNTSNMNEQLLWMYLEDIKKSSREQTSGPQTEIEFDFIEKPETDHQQEEINKLASEIAALREHNKSLVSENSTLFEQVERLEMRLNNSNSDHKRVKELETIILEQAAVIRMYRTEGGAQ